VRISSLWAGFRTEFASRSEERNSKVVFGDEMIRRFVEVFWMVDDQHYALFTSGTSPPLGGAAPTLGRVSPVSAAEATEAIETGRSKMEKFGYDDSPSNASYFRTLREKRRKMEPRKTVTTTF
jgi:hypothetical protein